MFSPLGRKTKTLVHCKSVASNQIWPDMVGESRRLVGEGRGFACMDLAEKSEKVKRARYKK